MELDRRNQMKRVLIAVSLLMFAMTAAMAQDTCASKAVDKNGKALSGAAMTSFMKKCNTDACNTKAVDQNGKPLAGAAKTSFVKKCVSDASKT
jgi:hypothetical protein